MENTVITIDMISNEYKIFDDKYIDRYEVTDTIKELLGI